MRQEGRRHRSAEETRDLLARARCRGLSQRELADELGLHPNTVGNWIRRERDGAGDRHQPRASVSELRSATLVPVRVVSEAPSDESARHSADRPIEIVLEDACGRRSIVVRLAEGVRAQDLETVFSVLGRSAC